MVATLSAGSDFEATGCAGLSWMSFLSEAIPIGFTRVASACVQKGIATEHQRHCLRVGVAHGADDGKTIPRMRHVLVR